MKVLVTGAAGFIGMHTSLSLLTKGFEVVGIDNLNDYYDPQIKLDRLRQLEPYSGFRFERMDIVDSAAIGQLFENECFEGIVHLAAQAGVRHSIDNPQAYVQSNLVGFLNVVEACRRHPVEHLVYASSSSVYGGNTKIPFDEADAVDHPVSLYAATKKANELMAHSYSHLFRIPTTGLRFFTVYGPWGRPDMAPFLFTDAIANYRPINVFNNGDLRRDFTYIDDIVAGITAVLEKPPLDVINGKAPYRILNIGNSEPIELNRFIAAIESALGVDATRQMLPMQPGDVLTTHANVQRLESLIGIRPTVQLEDGIVRFVRWYRDYSAHRGTKNAMKASYML